MISALLAALLLMVSPGAAEIVRLEDGTLVHGTIVEFDEGTGFTLRRADNGGLLRLRWEHLGAGEARRIKDSRGFTGEQVQPYMVHVVHLVLVNGTTESGLLVEDGPRDAYTLRRRGGPVSFPRNYVRSVETGRVEGLAVYRADELYQVILEDRGAPTDAAAHFALGLVCEGAGLYERAREHYRAGQQLDPDYRPERTALRLERVGIKIEDAAETEFLDKIRNRLYRNQFDAALGLVEEFRKAYPVSRQGGDLQELEGDIRARRRSYYSGLVISDYFSYLGKNLSGIARKDAMTLGAAMELAEGAVHDEIVARLARAYGLDEDSVQGLWLQRRGGSVRTSSYGTGTFILGESHALDFDPVGNEGDTGEVAPVTAGDDLQARIEKVLKKRQEERRRRQESARSKRSLDTGLSPDEWWERASSDDRGRWLTAYFAEFSGHVSVLRAKPRDCRTCNAVGTISVQNEKGEYVQATCPTCKSLKVERLVSFR